ncbi:MAG: hypothetical protein HWN68_02300 [Desulfobacterales bacterium]|nr:hypothetical protein [Desulfobacterales bacterium]
MSKHREEQDMLDKTILEILSKGKLRRKDIEKKVLASCHPWATYGRFCNRFRYLLKKEYIVRIARGIYAITETGRKYMELL